MKHPHFPRSSVEQSLQELKNAAKRLISKANELRTNTTQENKHLYDLVKLRKAWRIRHADRRISTAQYLLDYSNTTSMLEVNYKNRLLLLIWVVCTMKGGSMYNIEDERSGLPSPTSTELNRSDNGLELKSHPSLETTSFLCFESEDSIDEPSSSFFHSSSKIQVTDSKCVGSRTIHCNLLKARFSLFSEELFKKVCIKLYSNYCLTYGFLYHQMANEALLGNIPFVNIEEKEIRIEFATQPALIVKLQTLQREDHPSSLSSITTWSPKTDYNFKVTVIVFFGSVAKTLLIFVFNRC